MFGVRSRVVSVTNTSRKATFTGLKLHLDLREAEFTLETPCVGSLCTSIWARLLTAKRACRL